MSNLIRERDMDGNYVAYSQELGEIAGIVEKEFDK
jgi:hypothetical protein